MIYLDHGATSLRKPPAVAAAVRSALHRYANPGRGGYTAAMEAAKTVYRCRERAGEMFDCDPDRVVFTFNCTHGLNIAIRSLVKPGDRVLITGFEHNAVTRTLHGLGAETVVAGRRLFDWAEMLEDWEWGLRSGVRAAVFTHVSNVFGYILPVYAMARLCRQYGVPFVIDAAQSAGTMPISMGKLGADFIAMPGHKGLLGPQGTGLLLCKSEAQPLIFGGTGSESLEQGMPEYLPDRCEAGTLNVPGIAGLSAGMAWIQKEGLGTIQRREHTQAMNCVRGLENLGLRCFSGSHQAGTVSFVPEMDCEELAEKLGKAGVAVRAGLHCAPLAHESAGTLETGTVRISFGPDATGEQTEAFLGAVTKILKGRK